VLKNLKNSGAKRLMPKIVCSLKTHTTGQPYPDEEVQDYLGHKIIFRT
jgi:hypothetical protein